MLNMPILKFEKSCNYLKDQLQTQENTKQLLLDIIGNIGLISNDSSDEEKENYESVLESANGLLQTASSNIKTLEHLNLEISSITRELTDLLSDKNRSTKSKEFYIAAFSNLKDSITQYTTKFKNIETKLVKDEIDFNTFITENNLKYTFESVNSDSSETNYKFTGFSIKDNTKKATKVPEVAVEELDEKAQKINALTNEFKAMLNGLSEEKLSNGDLSSFLSSYVTSLSNDNIEVKETVTGARKDDLTEIIGFVKDSVEVEINEALNDTIEPTEVTEEVISEVQSPIVEDVTSETKEATEEAIVEEVKEETKVETPVAKPVYNSMESGIFDEYEDFNTSTFSKFKPLPKTNTVKKEEIFSSVSTTTAKNNVVFGDVDNVTEENDINEIAVSDLDITAEDIESLDSVTEETIIVDNEIEENLLDDLLLESIIEEDFKSVETKKVVIEKEEVQKPTLTIEEKIEKIKEAEADNESLIISERTNSIYLPYKLSELLRYVETYPNVYASFADVVEQEFILPFDYFIKHPFKSRFFETYNLIRNRQGKPVTHAVTTGLKLMYKHNLNPAIIAACKTEHELNSYLYYLDNKNLKGFRFFNIHYDINPL